MNTQGGVDVSICWESKNNNLIGKYAKNTDYPLLFKRGGNPLPLKIMYGYIQYKHRDKNANIK